MSEPARRMKLLLWMWLFRTENTQVSKVGLLLQLVDMPLTELLFQWPKLPLLIQTQLEVDTNSHTHKGWTVFVIWTVRSRSVVWLSPEWLATCYFALQKLFKCWVWGNTCSSIKPFTFLPYNFLSEIWGKDLEEAIDRIKLITTFHFLSLATPTSFIR